MKKEVYTAPEIARICRVSRFSVNEWINRGVIRAFRPMERGVWKVTRSDLVAFMEKQGYPAEFLKDEKISVLIVDDEVSVTDVLRKTLERDGRFAVETANSGFIAGAKLERLKPDIIVLDIYLGDMDGRELFQHLQTDPDFQETRVIAISGQLDDEAGELLLRQGFAAYLAKPFKMDTLKATIVQLMELEAPSPTVGDGE